MTDVRRGLPATEAAPAHDWLVSEWPASVTKQELVARHLRQAILDGSLAPGQRLRQEDVAKRLGLSWTPVREAFRRLEAEGWIRIEQHRGALVTPLSLDDFEEIYLLRVTNEPLLARLSVQRLDQVTCERLDALHAGIAADASASSLPWLEFLSRQREFHHRLYLAADQPRLHDLVMRLRDASLRYLLISATVADEPRQHLAGLSQLMDSCRRRDAVQAQTVMRHVLQRVRRRMRPVIDMKGASARHGP